MPRTSIVVRKPTTGAPSVTASVSGAVATTALGSMTRIASSRVVPAGVVATAGASVIPVNPGGLPSGVTLTAIDGGPTYYADNGFTYATATFTVNGATYNGWDDPNWFPIATFLDKYADSTHATRWTELGLNTALAVQGDVNLSLMNTNGHQCILQTSEWLNDGGNNVYHATLLANVPGLYLPDEPTSLTGEPGEADAYDDLESFPCSGTPPGNSGQTARFFCTTFQHGQVSFWDIDGTSMDDVVSSVRTTPCSTRTLGLLGVDEYFFNGQGAGPWPENANRIYNRSGAMTSDLMARAARYTDLARFIRVGNANYGSRPGWRTPPTPTYVFVETGTSYNENTTEASAIRVAQINSAVWGTLIGGCRFVAYFSNGDGGAWNSDSPVENKTFWDTIYNSDPRSVYDQLTLTNSQVLGLAPVLNSPFAAGYLSVSPSEQPLTSALNESGYATMVKYRNRSDDAGADNRFYIFAIPRYGNRTHNNAGADTGAETWPKTATFTIKNTGSTQVTVINEGRTIPVTNGGTQFQDSFANRETVHIYRVD